MFRMTVQDVFVIRGRGLVATGTVESGTISVGDQVEVEGGHRFEVTGVEMFRKVVDRAGEGDTVGLLFKHAGQDDIAPGAVLGSQWGGQMTGAEDIGLT